MNEELRKEIAGYQPKNPNYKHDSSIVHVYKYEPQWFEEGYLTTICHVVGVVSSPLKAIYHYYDMGYSVQDGSDVDCAVTKEPFTTCPCRQCHKWRKFYKSRKKLNWVLGEVDYAKV